MITFFRRIEQQIRQALGLRVGVNDEDVAG